MVIWLMGISGAGKTTLGKRLCEKLEREHTPHYHLDGDTARAVLGRDLGFTRADRETSMKRLILAAYVLDACDITAVVSAISPFEDLRAVIRDKVGPGRYYEAYLQKDIAASMAQDVKGMYKSALGKTEIIGKEIAFEEPKHPDIVLKTGEETEEESFRKLWAFYLSIQRKEVLPCI